MEVLAEMEATPVGMEAAPVGREARDLLLLGVTSSAATKVAWRRSGMVAWRRSGMGGDQRRWEWVGGGSGVGSENGLRF